MLKGTMAALFPTLSTNPELAEVLHRCESRLAELIRRQGPSVAPRTDDEGTAVLLSGGEQ